MAPLPAIYSVGELEIDEVKGELRRRGEPVVLRAKPLRLLLYLLRHRERVVPKQEFGWHRKDALRGRVPPDRLLIAPATRSPTFRI